MADSVQPGQSLQFTVSGTGSLPQEQAPSTDQSANSSQQASNGSRPGGGLGAPGDPNGTNDPWSQYKWVILGVLGLALVLGAGVMLKSGTPNAATVAGAGPVLANAEASALLAMQSGIYAASGSSPATGPGALLRALKDELFVLETDRLAGRLSEAEYAEHKAAFDVVLRRALARSEASPAASNE
jgi:hypothetical protein